MVNFGAPAAPNQAIANLRNATHKNWWSDPGMRKLSIALAVGFAGTINSGYDGSLFNGLQTMPLFFDAIQHPDANRLGLLGAAYSLGSIPAFIPASYIADRWGRRLGILMGIILIVGGSCVQAFSIGPWGMFAGRFIVGLGSAFQNVAGGPYVAEVAHPRNRAVVTALINTFWYVGSIIAAWTCFGALRITGSNWCWRLPCLIQALPCCFQLVALWFVPESPRYLISVGKEEQALEILARFHANGDSEDELVQFEFDEIREAIAAEKVAKSGTSYMSFFKSAGNKKRLVILIMVGIYSQWVGNGIISYYLAKILTSVGMTDPNSQAGLNGGLQIWNWFAAIGGSMMCERLGRRFLWLTSAIGMLFTFSAITACSAIYAKTENAGAGRAVIALLFLYFGAYDIAFTGLTVSYPLEILPFNLRTRGVAILQLVVSCALFFNQYVNPVALEALAWKYYFVYIGILCAAIVSIYFFYPETRGRTLEEVAEVFDGPNAPVHSGDAEEYAGDRRGSDEKKLGTEQEQVEYR